MNTDNHCLSKLPILPLEELVGEIAISKFLHNGTHRGKAFHPSQQKNYHWKTATGLAWVFGTSCIGFQLAPLKDVAKEKKASKPLKRDNKNTFQNNKHCWPHCAEVTASDLTSPQAGFYFSFYFLTEINKKNPLPVTVFLLTLPGQLADKSISSYMCTDECIVDFQLLP